MSPQSLPFYFMGGVLVLVAGGLYAGVVAQKKRREALRTVAQTMGFEFNEEWNADELPSLCGTLPIFDRGHSKKATNLMRGKLAGEDVQILDYRYTIGHGKGQQVHGQTLVVFASGAMPEFTLGPESFFHRIAQAFGYQDIDFDDTPEFSKHYLLRGQDEPSIRRAFTSEARALLSQMQGWHAEACGGHLAVYRSDSYPKPMELPTYAADALRIAGVLRSS